MEWLTKGTEFHAWQDKEQGVALLWLYGNSDAGRTLIMSYVLEHPHSHSGFAKNWDVAAIFCPDLLSVP